MLPGRPTRPSSLRPFPGTGTDTGAVAVAGAPAVAGCAGWIIGTSLGQPGRPPLQRPVQLAEAPLP